MYRSSGTASSGLIVRLTDWIAFVLGCTFSATRPNPNASRIIAVSRCAFVGASAPVEHSTSPP